MKKLHKERKLKLKELEQRLNRREKLKDLKREMEIRSQLKVFFPHSTTTTIWNTIRNTTIRTAAKKN